MLLTRFASMAMMLALLCSPALALGREVVPAAGETGAAPLDVRDGLNVADLHGDTPLPSAVDVAGSAWGATGLADSRPDIVLLVLDDIGEMDLRVWRRLPTIRRLFIEHGTRFTDYIGNDPLCCAGRANLLSGQRTDHHGVSWNFARSFDPTTSVATELNAEGYWTMIAGKYFNGTENLADTTPAGWDRTLIYSGGYWNVPMFREGHRFRAGRGIGSYTTDIIARTATTWVDKSPADQPLFLYLAPFGAHSGVNRFGRGSGYQQAAPAPRHVGDRRCGGIAPWSPPSYNEVDVSDKPAYIRSLPRVPYPRGWPLQKVCESLLSVDEMLADVVEKLTASGRTNVLFVLTSDNGMALGAHRWAKKRAPYATPMPLFLHWTAGLGPRRGVITTTATNLDIAPTLCELAGCQMGPYRNGHGADGLSLVGVMEARGGTLSRDYIVEEHHTWRGLPRWYGVRTTSDASIGRWVYTRYETGEHELYDLAADPWQLRNRAGDPAYRGIRRQLALMLREGLAR